MHITLNGQQLEVNEEESVEQLLTRLNLSGKRLALEMNGEILGRSQFKSTRLRAGDHLEIIVAVGGG
ncbi:MAG: sulfur carrier protein ThiS [Proteobacteria bacterium]|nr:sulfur carrier protein ThiS [Pseudomonadota bacterium]MDE3208881.1 sulfur carrier protein ThiS [Pseudomonadota bacterium]